MDLIDRIPVSLDITTGVISVQRTSQGHYNFMPIGKIVTDSSGRTVTMRNGLVVAEGSQPEMLYDIVYGEPS